MKNVAVLLRGIGSVLVATSIAAGSLWAGSARSLVVKVPFDFVVGQESLPAGEYMLSMGAPSPESVRIVSADGKQSVVVLAHRARAVDAQAAPALTFNGYGDTRFLSRVRQGNALDWEISPSSLEAEVARTAGGSAPSAETVASK